MIIRYKSPRAQPHEVLTVYPVHSEYVVRVPAPYNGRTSRLTLPFLFLLLSLNTTTINKPANHQPIHSFQALTLGELGLALLPLVNVRARAVLWA